MTTHPSTIRKRQGLAAALCLLLPAAVALAEWQFVLKEGSKLWLEGDSSIHKFEGIAEVIDLDTDVTLHGGAANSTAPTLSAVVQQAEPVGEVSQLMLVIPIKELSSPTVGLARPMHKALKVKVQPEIIFKMTDYSVGLAADSAGFEVKAWGDLSLGGTNRVVDLTMAAALTNDLLHVSGEKEILMTDFGIDPPTMMFGRIQVYAPIVIKWDLNLALQKKEGSDTVAP